MKIRLLVLTLLIIGVHQHIQAQYMLGTTGMMNIPTADRQKPGTVMLGGNYLPKQMMPARFDYNTGNYFVSISFFSFSIHEKQPEGAATNIAALRRTRFYFITILQSEHTDEQNVDDAGIAHHHGYLAVLDIDLKGNSLGVAGHSD